MRRTLLILGAIGAAALGASGCASYDERQAELHEILLHWQGAQSTYRDHEGEKVKVDRLPARDGRHEIRVRHLCSDCGMDNAARLRIAESAAETVMAGACPAGYTVLEEGHTVEPLGQKRSYRALSAGIRRYLFACRG